VPTNEKGVSGYTLFVEDFVALLPISHPLASAPSLSLNQLKADSFVLFPQGYVLRKLVVDACEQMGFTPKVSFEGEDIDAIKGLVAAGLGVTLIPEITLQDATPRTTVKIPIKEPRVTRTVGVIIPNNRDLAPSEKIFFEFLQTFFRMLNRFNEFEEF
jgi:LysR family transcriptional activator of glutamate synthase operon